MAKIFFITTWVMRIVETAQIIVLTVTCQSILGQVIGTAGEEVNFLSQPVGNDGCCGSFDHNADLNMIAVRQALSIQFLLNGLASCHSFGRPFSPHVMAWLSPSYVIARASPVAI